MLKSLVPLPIVHLCFEHGGNIQGRLIHRPFQRAAAESLLLRWISWQICGLKRKEIPLCQPRGLVSWRKPVG